MGVDLQTYRAKIGTFRHSVGVDVVTIVCCVNFSGGLKTVGSVVFVGLLLLIAGIEPNPGPKEDADGTDVEIVRPTAIQVSSLPDGIDDDTLVIIFEHQIYGGGKVKRVVIDPIKKSAILEFEEPNAVAVVLGKQPIKLLGEEVCVKPFEQDLLQRPLSPNENLNIASNETDTATPCENESLVTASSFVLNGDSSKMFSHENGNFIRFYLLLFKVGTDLLRKIVEKGLITINKTIDELLSSQGTESRVCGYTYVTKEMKQKLYPPYPMTRDISQWDIALLCFIILEFLNLNAPEELAVKKLRDFRNKMSHQSEPVIDNGNFTNWWTELVLIINTLSYGIQNYDDVIKHTSHVELDLRAALAQVQSIVQKNNDDIGTTRQSIEQLKRMQLARLDGMYYVRDRNSANTVSLYTGNLTKIT